MNFKYCYQKETKINKKYLNYILKYGSAAILTYYFIVFLVKNLLFFGNLTYKRNKDLVKQFETIY